MSMSESSLSPVDVLSRPANPPAPAPLEVAILRQANEINRCILRCTLTERRLIYLALSQIKSDEEIDSKRKFVVRARDLIALTGSAETTASHSHVYKAMKQAAEQLTSKYITIRYPIIHNHLFEKAMLPIVSYTAYDSKTASIEIRFNDELLVAFSQLKDTLFTYCQMEDFVGMRSTYAMALYLMLMQYMHEKGCGLSVKATGWCDIEIKDLKAVFECDDMPWFRFRQKKIDVAIAGINEATNAKFTVTNLKLIEDSKVGRQYTRVMFFMEARDKDKELSEAKRAFYAAVLAGQKKYKYNDKILDPSQIISALYSLGIVPYGAFAYKTVDEIKDKYFEYLGDARFREMFRDYAKAWGLFI